jgi:hypothetical protein
VKRVGNLFEEICERANLRLAVAKALRGKRAKADARNYVANLEANLSRLRTELETGTLSVGRFHQFTIYDPKQRLITAPCFQERVLHHAIMNICEAPFDRWLIGDTFACRNGKGRVACLAQATRFARRFPFFLKLDIRKYFDSIDHQRLASLLARRFKDRRLLKLFDRIIDSYAVSPGKGLPIGSLTSQYFANFYLGWFDRFAKGSLHCRGYVRYMDDMILWSETTARLRNVLDLAREFFRNELLLELKNEPYINRCSHGISMLGVRVFPTHQVLNRRSKRRYQSKLRTLDVALRNNELSEQEAQRRSLALTAFTRTPGLKSWCFRQRVLRRMADDE